MPSRPGRFARWVARAAVAGIIAASPAMSRAELVLRDWLGLYATDPQEADRVLGAAGDALLWANAVLGIEGKPRLFCPPPKVEVGLDDYRRLMEEAARSQGPENAARIDVPILLLRGLREAFPCGQGGQPIRR